MWNMKENKEISHLFPHLTSGIGVPPTVILALVKEQGTGSRLVQILSQRVPYFIIVVSDVPQAREVTKDVVPDLLLLEDGAAGMSGLLLYEQLCARKNASSIPALLLTHHSPYKQCQYGEEKKQHLAMPIEQADILKVLEMLLCDGETVLPLNSYIPTACHVRA